MSYMALNFAVFYTTVKRAWVLQIDQSELIDSTCGNHNLWTPELMHVYFSGSFKMIPLKTYFSLWLKKSLSLF